MCVLREPSSMRVDLFSTDLLTAFENRYWHPITPSHGTNGKNVVSGRQWYRWVHNVRCPCLLSDLVGSGIRMRPCEVLGISVSRRLSKGDDVTPLIMYGPISFVSAIQELSCACLRVSTRKTGSSYAQSYQGRCGRYACQYRIEQLHGNRVDCYRRWNLLTVDWMVKRSRGPVVHVRN